jgi:hypothetical protein
LASPRLANAGPVTRLTLWHADRSTSAHSAPRSAASKVRQQKPVIETEEATKNAFVMPFISLVLGYDVFNPAEVIPEFTADVGVKRGEKIDYALVHGGRVQILIETKRSTIHFGSNTPPSSSATSRSPIPEWPY